MKTLAFLPIIFYSATSFVPTPLSRKPGSTILCLTHQCHGHDAWDRRQALWMAPTDEESDGETSSSGEEEEESSAVPDLANSIIPPPPPAPAPRLDPLIATLTRMDAEAASKPTRSIPLLGEVPVDGSLVVLVPAILITVVGFVLSAVIAYNARDTFVDQLVTISEQADKVAIQKTNSMTVPDGECIGLCSNQEESLDSLKTFMEGLSNSKSR